MFTISPKAQLVLQVVVFVAVGVSQGAVHLTNMIPEGWIPIAVAYCGFIAFIGTGFTTMGSVVGLTNSSRVAAAQALPSDAKIAIAASAPEVKQIVTTPEIAMAAGPIGDGAKVVSK